VVAPPRSNAKTEAATVVYKLLMMGMRMPETCWAVFKRQAIILRVWCIWLVDLFECMMMHGLTNTKSLYMFRTVFPSIIRSPRLYIQRQIYVTEVRWLLASGYPLASCHRTCMTNTWRCMYCLGLLMMDGKTVRNMQSHIQQTRKIVHLVDFTVEIYHDARSHERQKTRCLQRKKNDI